MQELKYFLIIYPFILCVYYQEFADLLLKLILTVGNDIPSTGQVPVEEQVKTIMNKVYKETMKQFRPEESYSVKSIKSTLSAVIRVSYLIV